MTRKFLIPLLLCFACTPSGIHAQDTLLLFHPTAYNLGLLNLLSDGDLLDLEGVHVLGVYHSMETYDFTLSREYLQEHPELPFSLREIDRAIDPATLFGRND